MNRTLAILRARNQPVTRLMAALFVAVWLNMALVPCLMAAQPMMPAEAAGCDHCPKPAEPDSPACHDAHGDGGERACTWVDGYDYDGRTPGTFKLSPDLAMAPPPAPAAVSTPAAPAPVARADASPWCRQGPPLYLENCSFLN